MIKDRFSEQISRYLSEDANLILQGAYNPKENLKYESLFCLSNGYLGTRGSHEEGTVKSIPCTYINGVFDKSETFMRELANMPNWLGLKLYVEKQLLGVESCEILEFFRALDMKHALLAKRLILRDLEGRETQIEGVRFISRKNRHCMGIRLYVTPLNYSGIIEGENIIDGTTINFCDAPRFKVKHTYMTANTTFGVNGIYEEVATRDMHLHVGTGSLITAEADGKNRIKTTMVHPFGEQAIAFFDMDARENETLEITKYCCIYSGRDIETDCRTDTQDWIFQAVVQEIETFKKRGFETELRAHMHVYDAMWRQADIRIEGDEALDQAVRFNIFHLMSTGNEYDSHVNVGAKLLHGEEYGGHAFWDTELFMLPFFSHVFPKTAKNLELYRYHLLNAARENAAKNGYAGAQYPWESADDGTEQCPDWTIEPDGSCYRCYVAVYEHHVTAAVAYGIYHYVKTTGDWEFMWDCGVEILTETARFWRSRCEYNEKVDRFEIRKVTGPDEWHEPVDNNLYTNYLARWNLLYVQRILEEMKKNRAKDYHKLTEKISLKEEEIKEWETTAAKIYLPKKEGTILLEQFEGYFDLKEVLIEAYDENDWPIRPAALKECRARETQVIKQADVVMLLHLMGDEFDRETILENYHFYEKRTLHGSSLSPSIYAIMGLKVGDATKAYRYLKRAATLDLLDLQKNTREGIHAANAGGVWQTVVFGFAGVGTDENGALTLHPQMPKEWKRINFRIHHNRNWYEISIDGKNEAQIKKLQDLSYEAVIFDLDGVICHTDHYHYQAWKALVDKYSIPFDEEKNNRLRGVSRMESLEIILEDAKDMLSEEEKICAAEEKNTRYQELLGNMSPEDLDKNVKQTLDTLRERGIKLAIGSSSKNAKFILKQLGLSDYFDAISDGTTITKSKPDPEVFLKAAEFLGVAPEKCLVVEDAKAGAQAAHAGGMDCAVLLDAAQMGCGDYQLSSLEELLKIDNWR